MSPRTGHDEELREQTATQDLNCYARFSHWKL